MSTPRNGHAALVSWFLNSLQAAQEVEGGVRKGILELRRLRDSGRLAAEDAAVLAAAIGALEQAVGHLTVLQRLSREALTAVAPDPREGAATTDRPASSQPSSQTPSD